MNGECRHSSGLAENAFTPFFPREGRLPRSPIFLLLTEPNDSSDGTEAVLPKMNEFFARVGNRPLNANPCPALLIVDRFAVN